MFVTYMAVLTYARDEATALLRERGWRWGCFGNGQFHRVEDRYPQTTACLWREGSAAELLADVAAADKLTGLSDLPSLSGDGLIPLYERTHDGNNFVTRRVTR